jgi:hypothetical protein
MKLGDRNNKENLNPEVGSIYKMQLKLNPFRVPVNILRLNPQFYWGSLRFSTFGASCNSMNKNFGA